MCPCPWVFIIFFFLLCAMGEFVQESQVGSYIDDKKLRRKYANTVEQKHLLQQNKDDSNLETTNRLTTIGKVFSIKFNI